MCHWPSKNSVLDFPVHQSALNDNIRWNSAKIIESADVVNPFFIINEAAVKLILAQVIHRLANQRASFPANSNSTPAWKSR